MSIQGGNKKKPFFLGNVFRIVIARSLLKGNFFNIYVICRIVLAYYTESSLFSLIVKLHFFMELNTSMELANTWL